MTTDTDMFVRALGEELRLIRTRQGLSRARLIAEMGGEIATQTVASWENGDRVMPVSRLIQVCEALGVDAGVVVFRAQQAARAPTGRHLSVVPGQANANGR